MSVWEMNEILIYIHCNYINSTMLQGRQKTKNKKKKNTQLRRYVNFFLCWRWAWERFKLIYENKSKI